MNNRIHLINRSAPVPGAATTEDWKPSDQSETLDLWTLLRPRTGALHRHRRLPHICEIGSRLVQSASVALVLGFLIPVNHAVGAEPVKVRMGTLAPKGSSTPNIFKPWANNGARRRAAVCN